MNSDIIAFITTLILGVPIVIAITPFAPTQTELNIISALIAVNIYYATRLLCVLNGNT